MNSVPALTDLTPAQRRELLNMVRTRNLDELSDEELDRLLGAQP